MNKLFWCDQWVTVPTVVPRSPCEWNATEAKTARNVVACSVIVYFEFARLVYLKEGSSSTISETRNLSSGNWVHCGGKTCFELVNLE